MPVKPYLQNRGWIWPWAWALLLEVGWGGLAQHLRTPGQGGKGSAPCHAGTGAGRVQAEGWVGPAQGTRDAIKDQLHTILCSKPAQARTIGT